MLKSALVVILCLIYLDVTAQVEDLFGNGNTTFVWAVTEPILVPGVPGSFDETAVKDPSIVWYSGRWHLFYTARGNDRYSIGYVSSNDLRNINTAPRTRLQQFGDEYSAAPQVFFFEPGNCWYLIFQTRDANYQPVYSVTKTIDQPDSWSPPVFLVDKDDLSKWIDFWVICDDTTAYLSYTRAHEDVYVRTTALGDFPRGWGAAKKVLSGVHEAVHIYKVFGQEAFHMVYELNRNDERSFGLAAANHPAGSWTMVTDQYASGNQLQYSTDQVIWTGEVSHGEVLRYGYDQRLEYDPEQVTWLIQGLTLNRHTGPYADLPWQLGLILSVE